MGIDVPIVGGDGFDSTDLVKLAGNKNLNDVFFTTAYTTVDASDALTQLLRTTRKNIMKIQACSPLWHMMRRTS